MIMHVMYRAFRDAELSSERILVSGRDDAAHRVKILAMAGNRDISAEVIDQTGEVAHAYERGVWRTEAAL
jgi:hypothetical protein